MATRAGITAQVIGDQVVLSLDYRAAAAVAGTLGFDDRAVLLLLLPAIEAGLMAARADGPVAVGEDDPA